MPEPLTPPPYRVDDESLADDSDLEVFTAGGPGGQSQVGPVAEAWDGILNPVAPVMDKGMINHRQVTLKRVGSKTIGYGLSDDSKLLGPRVVFHHSGMNHSQTQKSDKKQ